MKRPDITATDLASLLGGGMDDDGVVVARCALCSGVCDHSLDKLGRDRREPGG